MNPTRLSRRGLFASLVAAPLAARPQQTPASPPPEPAMTRFSGNLEIPEVAGQLPTKFSIHCEVRAGYEPMLWCGFGGYGSTDIRAVPE